MTRGEALAKVPLREKNWGIVAQGVINEIYDDFESRTCKNCKQYINYHKLCRQDVSIFGESFLNKDFGCNKWEKKDDTTK